MPQKISFTLDGKKVEADKGLTIWEIANGQGIKILICVISLHRLTDRTEIVGHVWLR